MKRSNSSSKTKKARFFLSVFGLIILTGFLVSSGTSTDHRVIISGKDQLNIADSSLQIFSMVNDDLHFSFLTDYRKFLMNGNLASITPLFIFVENQKRKMLEKARLDSIRKKALVYAMPNEAGIDSEKLLRIDSIVLDAIERGAMPGAQVFVARRGQIIYEKAFGHHDYSGETPVDLHHLYDIASITKIAATTLAAMKLTQDGLLDLDAPLGQYFTDTVIHYTNLKMDTLIKLDTIWLGELTPAEINLLKNSDDVTFSGDSLLIQKTRIITPALPETNIFRIPVRNLLVHQSGINPSLPILPYYNYVDTYEKIMHKEVERNDLLAQRNENYEELYQTGNGIILEETAEVDPQPHSEFTFSFDKEEAFAYFYSKTAQMGTTAIKVADSMYLKKEFRDSLFADARRIRVHHDPAYQYACINMILLQMAIDSINGMDLDSYLKKQFFNKLGMRTTTFNPLDHFPKDRIVPTETDERWRRQTVHGTVHDPSAAILGGIAGNAGLFSTASDLGIFGQMLLNGGGYNGEEYLSKEIIDLFTQKQPENYRGLGFDKPSASGVHASEIAPESYGHLGFTGGALWVDPVNEIVFVFLSNRVTPSATNNLFSQLKVRQKVHQAVYDAIID